MNDSDEESEEEWSDEMESTDDTPLSDLIGNTEGMIKHEIKLEPVDQPVQLPDGTTIHHHQQPTDVKQEPGRDASISRTEYCYKCRICAEIFDTRYQFAVHVAKHEIQCVNCKCKYKTWKELENHEVYCTRRFGRILIPPRERKPPPKPKLRYTCCLCKRRYEKYCHLFDHQVKRCKKRYLKPQWVVKI